MVAPRRVAVAEQPLPMWSLLKRLGSSTQAPPWSVYLPERLRPLDQRCVYSASSYKDVAAFECGPQSAFSDGLPSPRRRALRTKLDNLMVAGRVWTLSQEAHGCRQVQEALDHADSNAQRDAYADELRGHILEAARCPHANHVLQKCIVTLPALSLQFVLDEIMEGNISKLACDKYGCRIVQRMVECCPTPQVEGLVDRLISDVAVLAGHPYGNYVVQVLLKHGTDEQRERATLALATNLRGIIEKSHGCAVMSTALSYGEVSHRQVLARRLLGEPGLLVFLAGTKYGHAAALRALEVLEGEDLKRALQSLDAEADALRESRYGREVVDLLGTFGFHSKCLSVQAYVAGA